MLACELRFPGGTYHATPWGAHVNEGLIEWPPSPWRLLRAMIATWHLKARDEIVEPTIRKLVHTLARVAPEYNLPLQVATGHSRHYMPLYDGNTTKVFDTFVRLDAGAMLEIRWPLPEEIPEAQHQAFAILISRMTYLGRAESWIEGAAKRPTEEWKPNAYPLGARDEPPAHTEVTNLLAPVPQERYAQWRPAALDERLTRVLEGKRRKAQSKGKPPDKEKVTSNDRKKAEQALPCDIFDALQVDTSDLHKLGWNRPPGSQWVSYARSRNALDAPATPTVKVSYRSAPTVARFAAAGAVRPRLTDALLVSEKLRRFLLGQLNDEPVFAGHDANGNPLQGHEHAFLLPEANGEHGHVSHLTLYARMGFDADARMALNRISDLPQKGGHKIKLVLLGFGAPEEFAGWNPDAGHCPLLVKSRTWVSRTPFVPTRHGKRRHNGAPKVDSRGLQLDGPAHNVLRLLSKQGYPEPKIEWIGGTFLSGKYTRWLQFRTLRKNGGGTRAAPRGFGFRLEFPEEVAGPIALGYGAHFGLGQFTPEGVFDVE